MSVVRLAVGCAVVCISLFSACEPLENTPQQPRAGQGSKADGWGTENNDALCMDGTDNDEDGFVDCCDWDCSDNWSVSVCANRVLPPEDNDDTCSDGLDNDGDCYTDCEDWDCSRNPNVTVCGGLEDANVDGANGDADAAADADAAVDADADVSQDDDSVPYVGASCDGIGVLPSEAEALADRELIAWLQLRMQANHRWLGYTEARGYLFSAIGVRQDGLLHSIYTSDATPSLGVETPEGFNTEHSWPRSWGAKGQAEADLHHLFVSSEDANRRRDSHPYGETNCTANCFWQRDGSVLGPGYGGLTVFQVHEESRGDIARAQFYFATRYGYPMDTAMEAVLKRWHCEDPPDDWERERHERIVETQSNRNLFIDHPGLVARIIDF